MTQLPHEVESILEIDRHKMQVSVAGQGSPLLMLNGLGASLELLAPLRRELADYHTIAFDPLGVGRSTELPMPMRLPAHAKTVVHLLDHLGIDKIDLFGVSWGGALAQEIAYRYPDRVNRLILTSTTAGPGLVASLPTYLAFFDPRIRTSDAYVARVAPKLFGGLARSDSTGLFEKGIFHRLAKKTSKRYLYQMAAAAGWSSLRYLWTLRQETLILTGDDDPLVRPYNSRLIHAMMPNSKLHVMKGEGHLMIVTSAKETAGLIRDFLGHAKPQLRVVKQAA